MSGGSALTAIPEFQLLSESTSWYLPWLLSPEGTCTVQGTSCNELPFLGPCLNLFANIYQFACAHAHKPRQRRGTIILIHRCKHKVQDYLLESHSSGLLHHDGSYRTNITRTQVETPICLLIARDQTRPV